MTGDGGLIALSVDDAERLLAWLAVCHSEFDGISDFTADDALGDRISEWIARHSEATP